MGQKIKNVVKMVKSGKILLTFKSNQPIVLMRYSEGGKEGRGQRGRRGQRSEDRGPEVSCQQN